MIEIQLKRIADKLGKSISDIARETGLNRNTVTALYHGRVDGIKFDTLERLCKTYNLSIVDLVILSVPSVRESWRPAKLYKQEGDLVPITVWWPFVVANNLPITHFDSSYGELSIYCKKVRGYVYLDFKKMQKLAETSFHRYGAESEYKKLWLEYEHAADLMETLYREIRTADCSRATVADLSALFQKIADAYREFWEMCIFIDSFDAGFDSAEIDRIAKRCGITKEVSSILATPIEPTFNTERQIAFLTLAKKYARKKRFSKDDFLNDPLVREYQAAFDWHTSNYAFAQHITAEEMVAEIRTLLSSHETIVNESERLRSAPLLQKKNIAAVIKQYGLSKNPLWFFQRLTYWREHRKKVNLMGIQSIYTLLGEVEKRTGIAGKYLKFLIPDEFERVLRGTISQEMLKVRYEKGILLHMKSADEYAMYEGSEAASLRDELEAILQKDVVGEEGILYGTVASQGYARGVARVVLGREDFCAFKEGEILVTGMTRPEFLPLMKAAAGIVTNEGGLTSHAAIVSRELGKPCVIGTKRATSVIKNGDVVEVRAHHGTVRIVQRAEA